jgi:hypothetical protein
LIKITISINDNDNDNDNETTPKTSSKTPQQFMTEEYCPFCGDVYDIPGDKISPCPNCGILMMPCSQCPNPEYTGCGTEKCPYFEYNAEIIKSIKLKEKFDELLEPIYKNIFELISKFDEIKNSNEFEFYNEKLERLTKHMKKAIEEIDYGDYT